MRAALTRVAAVAASATIALSFAPAAQASSTQLSVFQDDKLLVLSEPSTRERTLDDLALLGVDTIHSIVFWNRVAPAPLERTRPDGFDGSDPAAYPAEHWDRYDGLVRGANARGMELIFAPSSPLPYWASRCRGGSKIKRTCRPDPTQFKRFMEAIGKRYSGDYADENQGRGLLPRVSRWAVWNEPNQGGWLTPQWIRRNGRVVPYSPGLYRGLVRAAIKGLRDSGHASDEIMLGETAPLGRSTGPATTRPMAPGAFFRGVLCIDGAGRSLRGPSAAALDCTGPFSKLRVTAISHHPYTRGGSRPPTARGGANEITISSISRLKSILRRGARRQRIPGGLPLYYTEFGFQTNPPDTIFGVSLSRQAQWLNQSDWIAWQDKQIKAVAQYELRDEADAAAFQTGLQFIDGRRKPGFDAYRMPIWVRRAGGGNVRVWGQIRPADDDALENVEIQNDPENDGTFQTVATATTTNRKGFIYELVPSAPGVWRLLWAPKEGGPAITSRVAGVARR